MGLEPYNPSGESKPIKVHLNRRDAEARLKLLLAGSDVPEMRREINETNLRWLTRNVMIGRSENHTFYEAILTLAKFLLRDPES